MAPLPTVIVTRPQPEAQRWADSLNALGLPARALPLIDIHPAPLAGPLLAARQRLMGQALPPPHALMFVSGQAVRCFFAPEKHASKQVPIHFDAIQTRAWSPGPGTSAALRQAGWPAHLLDEPAADAAQFDSEALWARVQPQARPGRHVLIVRGGDAAGRPSGRQWLSQQLRAAGVVVDEVTAYRRSPPAWTAASAARAAQAAHDGSLWLFSSSEAIAHLCQALPAQDWSAARALATHPRIVQAAQAAGFGRVWPTQPSLASVAASIKSLPP